MNFTSSDYTDMLICYGIAGENANRAVRIYAERFPNRRRPTVVTILRCLYRARETGTLIVQRRNRLQYEGVIRRNVRIDEQVLEEFDGNPSTSIRRASSNLGIPRSLVHRILKEEGLHPFHYQRVQQLLPRDEEQRTAFCAGFLAQCRRNPLFYQKILWTDAALFTPNGIFNSKNFIFWANKNPHAIREGAFQYRWKLNVWVGIIGDAIIGPYFLPPNLNGEMYANFLEDILPNLLEDLPLETRRNIILQQDGAPPHFARRARQILNLRFANRWMGRGGPIAWPARSPDLNVLDYFVWGHIKAQTENMRDRTVEEVREAIIAAFGTITPDMVQRATQQIVRRAELCLQAQGRHFEQLLR